MKDLLTIVVPIYNVEDYLCRCLDSLIEQTYKKIEIILVDDGSTDKSGEIADQYKLKDNRIKVIHKKNGGLSDARNKGIENASGEYITFVDSDDYVEVDIYEKSMLKIKSSDVDILVFEIVKNYSNGVNKYFNISCEGIIDNKDAIIKLNTFKNIDFSACNKIYKKELFNDITFPLGKKCEDVYTMYKIFDIAKFVYLLPCIGYHYCLRDGSITTSNDINIDYILALKEQMEYFQDDNVIGNIAKSSYAYSCLAIVNMIILKNIDNNELKKQMRSESKKYSKYIYKNKYLSFKKKLQYFVFDYFFLLYVYIIKLIKL